MTRLMTALYLQVDCPKCGEEILVGPRVTLMERHGNLVIPADMVTLAGSRVDCPTCGAAIYYGNLDFVCEGGRDPEPHAPPDEVA